MARKSRKNIPEVVSSATVQTEVSRPFRAGLYARISMETEETLERGTIETQVELMKNFVADTEDIRVAEVYKDSDYSGTNFDRPGFYADDGRYQAWKNQLCDCKGSVQTWKKLCRDK